MATGKNGNGKSHRRGFVTVGKHNIAERVTMATAARNEAVRDLFARMSEHHAVTIEALTATLTAADFASSSE
jgi:hypothetical protein